MASRSRARPRPRLFESQTEETLRRRGTELVGLAMLAVAGAITLMLATYSAEDPSLRNATDAAPANALGLVGSHLADPLHQALGWAVYGIAAAIGVWGLRLILHLGEGRAVTRLMLVPPAVVVAAAFAAAHVPPPGWEADYGLGGLIGDAALGGLLGLLPTGTAPGLPIATLALAALLLVLGGAALGLTLGEAGAILRFLGIGVVVLYAGLIALTGRAAGRLSDRRGRAGRTNPAAPTRAAPRRRAGRAPEPPLAAADWEDPVEPDPAPSPPPADGIAAVLRGLQRGGGTAAGPASGKRDTEEPPAPGAAPGPDPLAPLAEPLVQIPQPRGLTKSSRARAEEQPRLALDDIDPPAYTPPPLSLLASPTTIVRHHLSEEALAGNARMLEAVLEDYGIRGEIVSVRPGPVVTMYELEPAAGLKASRVIGLADDIARSMSALACRVSTIPGRSVIGIELPNDTREKVLLREILASKPYGDGQHALPLALGKDIGGQPVITNLARMPHLLIAGTTGSGKSVAINTMILSLLYRLSPQDCRLIMIDPKMLELSVYDGIPHLLSPVVTDPKKAVVALKWVVAEMEERYRKMSRMGVRNIDGYNERVAHAEATGEGFSRTIQTGFDEDTGEPVFETEEYTPERLPYIVVIVDEMADLMMVAGKEIEACIQRLAQMARASGIHLIMATQRPSVDVITGTIKANFPTRISFQVTSKIDSRTILGEMGAEQLLGQGDMLFMAGGGRVTRVHGPFVSDAEVEEVVQFLKAQGAPEYEQGIVEGPEAETESEIDLVLGLGGNTGNDDALYDQAVAIVARDRKCSTSYIQRKLAIGYNKAARLVEMMEEQGVVSAANQVGKREVLVPER